MTALLLSSITGQLTDRGAEIVGSILLAVALVLVVAEFFSPTHGSVAVGGLVILVVGLIVLAQATGSAAPIALIVALGVVLALFAGMVVFEIVMARNRPVTTGMRGLENEIGVVREAFAPAGTVFVHGERWRAVTADGAPLPVGTPVRIIAVRDLTLTVQYAPETATTLPPMPGDYDTAPVAPHATVPTQRSLS